MSRTIGIAVTLGAAALSTACSSSSSGGNGDASAIDAMPAAEADASAGDASDEQPESPVYGCSEAQLSYATGSPACGQCVASNCAMLLSACTNCVLCEMQLTGCPACVSMCFSRAGTGAPASDSGP